MKPASLYACALLALMAFQPIAGADPLIEHPGRWLGDLRLPNGQILKIGAEFLTRADGSP